MSAYDLHFNKDDVTIRNIIIGLLATLYDNIHWYNQIGNKVDERILIKVPFYFSTTGTERYLQDNFLNNVDFDPDMLKAETFYNKIPRGIIDLSGVTIESAAIVNKYVRMEHQVQEADGTLNTYNTEAFMVPILLDVDGTIYVDSILDQMKCTESLIRTFFKSKTYQIDTAYTRIPCLIVFPDDYATERTVEFSFTDKKEFKVTFSLQIKAHIPIFKENTTFFAGNTMESFQANTYLPPLVFGPSGGGSALLTNQPNVPPPTGNIDPVAPSNNTQIPEAQTGGIGEVDSTLLNLTGPGNSAINDDIVPGMVISGEGISPGTTVISVDGDYITLSSPSITAMTGPYNFSNPNPTGPTPASVGTQGQSFGVVQDLAPTGPTGSVMTTGPGGSTLGPIDNLTPPGPTTYFSSSFPPDSTWPISPSTPNPPNGGTGYGYVPGATR
jgi:hypothetical protein